MIICIFLFLLILGLILKLCKKGYYEGICLASIFLFTKVSHPLKH